MFPMDTGEQPRPVLIDSKQQYEVEHILAEWKNIYMIRWMGYDSSYES